MLETIDSTLESILKSSISISFYYKILKYQSENNLKWVIYVAVILQSINMIQNIIREQVIQL
jgi:hypothetical protein